MLVQFVTSCRKMVCHIWLERNLVHLFRASMRLFKLFFLRLLQTGNLMPLIISFDNFSIFGDCHSVYHFPISTSNDNCFTHLDIHCSTSLYSCFFQASEALQPSLMDMIGLHCLGMTIDNDQIYFPLQYSHRDLTPLVENSSFSILQAFQRGHHEFYDPIIEWLCCSLFLPLGFGPRTMR